MSGQNSLEMAKAKGQMLFFLLFFFVMFADVQKDECNIFLLCNLSLETQASAPQTNRITQMVLIHVY